MLVVYFYYIVISEKFSAEPRGEYAFLLNVNYFLLLTMVE